MRNLNLRLEPFWSTGIGCRVLIVKLDGIELRYEVVGQEKINTCVSLKEEPNKFGSAVIILLKLCCLVRNTFDKIEY